MRTPSIVVASAARTAVGSFNDLFATTPAHELGPAVIKGVLDRAGVEAGEVDEVIFGQVLSAGEGQNTARQAAMKADIPQDATAWGMNQLCGSGLRAVALGMQQIATNGRRRSADYHTGPIPASRKALEKAGWSVAHVELVQANEAFAARAHAVNKDLGWDTSIVNVNGGAIATGHPIGASGARVLSTLLFEMKRRGVSKGLATLCIGGGMGVASAWKRCEDPWDAG